jgi:hypothetical protein
MLLKKKQKGIGELRLKIMDLLKTATRIEISHKGFFEKIQRLNWRQR